MDSYKVSERMHNVLTGLEEVYRSCYQDTLPPDNEIEKLLSLCRRAEAVFFPPRVVGFRLNTEIPYDTVKKVLPKVLCRMVFVYSLLSVPEVKSEMMLQKHVFEYGGDPLDGIKYTHRAQVFMRLAKKAFDDISKDLYDVALEVFEKNGVIELAESSYQALTLINEDNSIAFSGGPAFVGGSFSSIKSLKDVSDTYWSFIRDDTDRVSSRTKLFKEFNDKAVSKAYGRQEDVASVSMKGSAHAKSSFNMKSDTGVKKDSSGSGKGIGSSVFDDDNPGSVVESAGDIEDSAGSDDAVFDTDSDVFKGETSEESVGYRGLAYDRLVSDTYREIGGDLYETMFSSYRKGVKASGKDVDKAGPGEKVESGRGVESGRTVNNPEKRSEDMLKSDSAPGDLLVDEWTRFRNSPESRKPVFKVDLDEFEKGVEERS